jgi:Ca2+-transporting ATPase
MDNWHQIDIPKVLELTGGTDMGLSTREAAKKLLSDGPNEIIELKTKPAWIIFLFQFKDVMIMVLIGAAIISAVVGDISDTIIILSIIILNAIIGFLQEYRAEKAINALKQLAVPNILVMRNQKLSHVSSLALVRGDMVVLEAGNIIPADLRLSETHRLTINESALTGESASVEKHNKLMAPGNYNLGEYSNMAFKGTYITQGRVRGFL